MIIGYLSNINQEGQHYIEPLRKGLWFLRNTDIAALPLGRHEIDGDKIFALVSEYDTQPKYERRPERHEKYIDIQYIGAGEEMIGVAPLAAAGVIDQDALAERDVVYYQDCTEETEIILACGMFGVYFPWDIHRPNCAAYGRRSKVRKVVVKIAATS